MRKAHSIVFYAWAGLVVQVAFALGVIAFVLSGAATQRSAIGSLHDRVDAVQVANLALLADFLDAQDAARGYQATGRPAILRAFHARQDRFAADLVRVRRLAWGPVIAQVRAEQRTARAAFLAGDRAALAPAGSAAARQYTRAAALSGRFVSEADRLRHGLTRDGDALAARSMRLLGVGLGWTIIIVAAGFMLPVIGRASCRERV